MSSRIVSSIMIITDSLSVLTIKNMIILLKSVMTFKNMISTLFQNIIIMITYLRIVFF